MPDAAAAARLAFNMKVLRRHDARIDDIIESASFVVLYAHIDGEWKKTGIEGPMFLFRRSSDSPYGFFIMNRNGVENFSASLSQADDLDLTSDFIIYRPGSSDDDACYGVWIFEPTQRESVGQQMLSLQENSGSSLAHAAPVASAAGVSTSQQASGAAVAAAAAPSVASGQSISLDVLFGSAAATARPSPRPQPAPKPAGHQAQEQAQAKALSGPSLLNSMFQSAAAQQAPAATESGPSASPPKTNGAADATQLMQMLGLGGGAKSLALEASGSVSQAQRSPSSSEPHCAGHLTAAPLRSDNATYDFRRLPEYERIPPVAGQPHGCVWGLFDTVSPQGERVKDQLGTLNLLTPENTLAATRSEIRTGERIQLDWSLDKPSGGGAITHRVKEASAEPPLAADEVTRFVSHGSSRWIGFRRLATHGSHLGYNGLGHQEVVSGRDKVQNGIHAWSDAGGIAGRGVLIDWLRWWRFQHPGQAAPHPCSRHAIPLRELLECAAWQRTEIRPADVLLVRTGTTEWYERSTVEERAGRLQGSGRCFIGVEASEEMKRFLWNSHLSAVGSDSANWDAPTADPAQGLKQYLLPMWGMPIAELLDLEALSESCARQGRWSFFLTSAPLRVPGTVASPPNMMAIF